MAETPASTTHKVDFEIIIGTYEEFLIGYQLFKTNDGYTLTQSFTNHAHTGSIRCLSSTHKFVASGSTDESVRLFNMNTRQEFGALMQHNGTITSLDFCGTSHLVSSSEDGNICIWGTNNWQCLKTLRGHKQDVTSISVHPSRKLLLSVSKDKTLRTWNLVKGRSAYVTNIKKVSEIVRWSPEGTYFVTASLNHLDVYSAKDAGVIHSIDFGNYIAAITFLTDDLVVIGGESENIEIHSISKKSLISSFKAHNKRIKGLRSTPTLEDNTNLRWLATTSSDGFVKLWEIDLKQMKKKEPQMLSEIDSHCRPTCLTVCSKQLFSDTKEQTTVVKEEKTKRIATEKDTDDEESKEQEVPRKKKKVTIKIQNKD